MKPHIRSVRWESSLDEFRIYVVVHKHRELHQESNHG